MVKLTLPYIPGFLAFREVDFILDRFRVLKETQPQFMPQVVFVDGNGILHTRGFGMASHLGTLLNLPSVGVGKTFFHVDGLDHVAVKQHAMEAFRGGANQYPLVGQSGRVWGCAVRSTADTLNPIYVSVGHRLSLETATKLALNCCRYRVPEPIRQADQRSREFLRKLPASHE
eukprot:Colp12_sorted_trinity150504_noHs@14025